MNRLITAGQIDRRAEIEVRLSELGKARAEARDRDRSATSELQRLAPIAAELGLSETRLAQLAQVTRMTVRAWLGKR
jgi:hypothetical protein